MSDDSDVGLLHSTQIETYYHVTAYIIYPKVFPRILNFGRDEFNIGVGIIVW
jgi:hypothetical protein